VTNLVRKDEREFDGVGSNCVPTAWLEGTEDSWPPAGRAEESESGHRGGCPSFVNLFLLERGATVLLRTPMKSQYINPSCG
jgi:hypothetical protein